MNGSMWIGLLAAAMIVVGGAPEVGAADLTTIHGPQLEALMADGRPLTVVDVREPELFAAGHIPGAVNIPYDDARPRIVRDLSPDERIVFVCHGGPMGDELGALLAARGYGSVYNLAGGMKKWRGAVVK
ncbi:MAG: rhodanese-like domain-containing protein [Nitrospirota bacterium]